MSQARLVAGVSTLWMGAGWNYYTNLSTESECAPHPWFTRHRDYMLHSMHSHSCCTRILYASLRARCIFVDSKLLHTRTTLPAQTLRKHV